MKVWKIVFILYNVKIFIETRLAQTDIKLLSLAYIDTDLVLEHPVDILYG